MTVAEAGLWALGTVVGGVLLAIAIRWAYYRTFGNRDGGY